jgi:hypothetical protein
MAVALKARTNGPRPAPSPSPKQVKQRLPAKATQVERLSALEQRFAHNTATRKRRLAYAAAYGGAHVGPHPLIIPRPPPCF